MEGGGREGRGRKGGKKGKREGRKEDEKIMETQGGNEDFCFGVGVQGRKTETEIGTEHGELQACLPWLPIYLWEMLLPTVASILLHQLVIKKTSHRIYP